MKEEVYVFFWQALFAIVKGITYLLFIAVMIKYLWSY